MKVQVIVDGKLVLEGTGRVETLEEGTIELVVKDAEGNPFLVQYADVRFDEYIKYCWQVDKLPISAYPLSYTEWLDEQEKTK